jgi:hypothetical protein
MATLERRVERLESEVPAADDFRHLSLEQIEAELRAMYAKYGIVRPPNMTRAELEADLAALEAEMERRGIKV